jgi:hypothetical protein
MENEDANIAGEDELAHAQQLAGQDADGPPEEEGPDDTFEVELDGQVHTLPGALKGAFLRQADYTRKTQELAEHRRAAEAERRALAERTHAVSQVSRDQVTLAALDHQIEDFADIDWQAYAAEDPEAAQTLWGRLQGLAQARERLAYAVSHHEERSKLQAAREAAEQMAETGRTLQREIEGWSPEIASKLVEYAQAFGVTKEELAQMADPRLWKLLHKAYRADEAGQKDGAARSAAQAQAVRPAVLVSGAASGGGVRDELATKEWMARRNAQMAKGR